MAVGLGGWSDGRRGGGLRASADAARAAAVRARERAGRGCDARWRRGEGGGVGESEVGLGGWSDGRRGGELRASADAARIDAGAGCDAEVEEGRGWAVWVERGQRGGELAEPASKLFSLKAYLRSASVKYHSPYASLFCALLR